jgi:iron complex transport system substrate-binding protein
MKKFLIAQAVVILFFCLIAPVEGITPHNRKGESICIQDALGESVEVRLPVKRLVVLTSDALEVVRALKAQDLVVGINNGITKDPLFWPRLKDRPVVGKWSEPDYEMIASLNPDMVISYARYPGAEMERKLTPLGIKVVRLDFYKLSSLSKEVETLGRILKREKEAKELTAWYREKLNLIQEGLRHVKGRPDVYVESYTEYHTTGPGSGGHEMCVLAGGHNIASDFSISYPQITPEWVLANNPHVIIKAAALGNCYAISDPAPLKSVRDKIMDRPVWDNIRAVQEGTVYVMASDIWTGPRAIIGISYMAKWFYPEVFRNFDPETLHREYLENFQGIKYRGMYVYPVSSRQ